MDIQRYKLVFPLALNTVDATHALKSDECTENYNLIRLIDGSIRAHDNWGSITFDGCSHLIDGIEYVAPGLVQQLVVFGIDTSFKGFIGVIKKGVSTIEKLMEDMDPYTVPKFVLYRNRVYIFLGVVYVYDGLEITECELLSFYPSMTGAVYRGRLWFEDGGILRFTEVGTEEVLSQNFFQIRNVDDTITDLIANSSSLFIGKRRELHEISFGAVIEDASQKCRSENAGMLNNRSATRNFETIFFTDGVDAFLLNPTRINVNPEQLLEVDPGVWKVSKPVRNILVDYASNQITNVIRYRRLGSQDSGVYKWSIGDFEHTYCLGIDDNPNYFDWLGPTMVGYVFPVAWGISYKLTLPEGQQWAHIRAFGWIKDPTHPGTPDVLKLYVSLDGETDWREVDCKYETYLEGYTATFAQTWWNDWRNAPDIYFKLYLENHLTVHKPFLHDITIYTRTTKGSHFATGFNNDRFYIFGSDNADARLNMGYGDGWFRFLNNNHNVHSLINDLVWSDNESVVGFGVWTEEGKGALITRRNDETPQGSTTTIVGETGDVGYPDLEMPKKLRRIFITYKSAKIVTLKVYGEAGWSKTITLPIKSYLGMSEINFASTRSKWFRYRIEASADDFHLKEFEVEVKTFAIDEI